MWSPCPWVLGKLIALFQVQRDLKKENKTNNNKTPPTIRGQMHPMVRSYKHPCSIQSGGCVLSGIAEWHVLYGGAVSINFIGHNGMPSMQSQGCQWQHHSSSRYQSRLDVKVWCLWILVVEGNLENWEPLLSEGWGGSSPVLSVTLAPSFIVGLAGPFGTLLPCCSYGAGVSWVLHISRFRVSLCSAYRLCLLDGALCCVSLKSVLQ